MEPFGFYGTLWGKLGDCWHMNRLGIPTFHQSGVLARRRTLSQESLSVRPQHSLRNDWILGLKLALLFATRKRKGLLGIPLRKGRNHQRGNHQRDRTLPQTGCILPSRVLAKPPKRGTVKSLRGVETSGELCTAVPRSVPIRTCRN
jgi:hypothetical protein